MDSVMEDTSPPPRLFIRITERFDRIEREILDLKSELPLGELGLKALRAERQARKSAERDLAAALYELSEHREHADKAEKDLALWKQYFNDLNETANSMADELKELRSQSA